MRFVKNIKLLKCTTGKLRLSVKNKQNNNNKQSPAQQSSRAVHILTIGGGN